MSTVINIKQSDFDHIVAHCKKELPNEACGLVAGKREGEKKIITEVFFLKNVDESNEHFSMEPVEQLMAIKMARKHGVEILGNFHSHPETPARPSEEDRRLAFDSSMEYLILSLQDKDNPVLSAYEIDSEKKVTKHDIVYL